jgi:hypothetical protein
MSEEEKKDQEEFEGQMSSALYKDLLEKSYEKVAGLKQQLIAIQNQTVTLRDKIASAVYPGVLVQSMSSEQAAEDAYRAADALLRVRETGHVFDNDLITLFKEMRDSTPDDVSFGRTIRNFLKDK